MLAFKPFFEDYIYLVVQIAYNREAVRGFFRWASININKEDKDINYIEL